jgi:predicted ester cyclase
MLSKLFFTAAFFTLVITAPLAAQTGKNETTLRNFWAAVDMGNFDKAASLLSPDVKVYIPVSPKPLTREEYRQVGEGFRMGFPDISHKVLESTESGSTVAMRGLFTGTNTGSLMGNPPTGNRVEAPFLSFVTFDASGKIIRFETAFDLAGFNAQVMAGIQPGAAAEATIRAMLATADEGDSDKFISYWAPNAVNYFAGKQTSGNDLKIRIAGMKAAFPDIKRTLDEVVVSGNYVTVKGWVTGTNKGTYQGQAPTGNSVKVAWLGLYKLNAEGKIQEGTVEFDTTTLNNQVKGAATGATSSNN